MSEKECTGCLYYVHAGVVDWRLAVKKIGIIASSSL